MVVHRLLLLYLCLLTLGYTQIFYSGYVHPSQMLALRDGKEISLPFRITELQAGWAYNSVELKTTSAVEYRWTGGQTEYDLREAYLVWYPSFGEVSLGKQILAWGAADGNNPTDNLNAYNYYYMFLTGTDRKIGSVSALVKYYGDNWQLEGVFIGEHRKNILPFNEPDFPIPMPPEPPSYVPIDAPAEWGARILTTLGNWDMSLSYFTGRDRSFSLMAVPTGETFYQKYGFRKTSMVGADAVTFMGDLTFRGEMAYFHTTNDYSPLDNEFKLDAEVKYLQYVFQTEYTTPGDITVTSQLLGTSYLSVEGKTMLYAPGETGPAIVSLTEDNFRAGMGTPFAIITDLGLMVFASFTTMDNRLELKGGIFQNLEEPGTMLSLEGNYSPIENWNLHLALVNFIGDGSDDENIFTKLEDFSHIRLGIEYSF